MRMDFGTRIPVVEDMNTRFGWSGIHWIKHVSADNVNCEEHIQRRGPPNIQRSFDVLLRDRVAAQEEFNGEKTEVCFGAEIVAPFKGSGLFLLPIYLRIILLYSNELIIGLSIGLRGRIILFGKDKYWTINRVSRIRSDASIQMRPRFGGK